MPVTPGVLVFPGQPDGVAGALAALAAQTVTDEIADRLGRDAVELATAGNGPHGLAADGVPVRALWPWDPGRADQFARGVAAAVVTGEGPMGAAAATVVDDLSTRGVIVEIVPSGADDADPLVLADRVHPAGHLGLRADLLRLAEVLPPSGEYVLGHVEHGPPGADVSLESLAFRHGMILSTPGPEPSPLDLAALVAGAKAVVTDRAALGSLAAAYGRASGGLTGTLPRGLGADRAEARRQAALMFLDRLCDRLEERRQVVGRRPEADLVAEMEERVRVLLEVNAGLRRRIDSEREALVARLRSSGRLSAGRPAPGPAEAALVEARAEIGRLRQELDRLYATRTMRAVQPARRIYGRLRSTLR